MIYVISYFSLASKKEFSWTRTKPNKTNPFLPDGTSIVQSEKALSSLSLMTKTAYLKILLNLLWSASCSPEKEVALPSSFTFTRSTFYFSIHCNYICVSKVNIESYPIDLCNESSPSLLNNSWYNLLCTVLIIYSHIGFLLTLCFSFPKLIKKTSSPTWSCFWAS